MALISIVVPNYNKEDYVWSCLESLVNQITNVDYEIILVDDGSTDSSIIVIENFINSYVGQVSIKFFPQPHRGKINTFNFAVKQASGFFIKLFGSDDIAYPEMINVLASCAKKNSIILHNCDVGDSCCKILKKRLLNIDDSSKFLNIVDVINGKSFPSGNYLFPIDVLNSIFPLPESASYEDWYISMKIAINNVPITFVFNSLFMYRQVTNSNWGGVFNFSLKVLQYRAKRDLSMIKIFMNILDKRHLSHLKLKEIEFNEIINFSFLTFIFKKVTFKAKLIVYIKILLSIFTKNNN